MRDSTGNEYDRVTRLGSMLALGFVQTYQEKVIKEIEIEKEAAAVNKDEVLDVKCNEYEVAKVKILVINSFSKGLLDYILRGL